MAFDYTLCWDRDGHWNPRTARIDLQGIDSDDHLARQIRDRETFYEIDLLEHIAMAGPRGGTFVDVGANIGNHSVYFGKFLADRVICVEPSAALIPVLQRNLQTNGVIDPIVIHGALGAESGVGRVVAPPSDAHNIGMTQVETVGDARDASEPVSITTLDAIGDIVTADSSFSDRTHLPIRLVKIDVEGMELDVLRGGESVLSQQRPQLAIELGNAEHRETVCAYLARFGYEPIGCFCYTPTYHFIDPTVHRLRKPPSRLARSWHLGGARLLREKLGLARPRSSGILDR